MSKRAVVVLLSVVALVVGGGAWAAASVVAASSQVKACVTSKGVIRAASARSTCPKGTSARAINVTGPRGATGLRGATGAPGATGPRGPGAVSTRVSLPTFNGPYAVASLAPVNVAVSCVGGLAVTISQGSGQIGKVSGTLTRSVDGAQTGGASSLSPSNGSLTLSVPAAGSVFHLLQYDGLVTVLPTGATDPTVYELRFAVYHDVETTSCDVQVRITP